MQPENERLPRPQITEVVDEVVALTLAAFEAEMAQRREMWDSDSEYFERISTLSSELSTFTLVRKGILALSPMILAMTEAERYGSTEPIINLDEVLQQLDEVEQNPQILMLDEVTLGNQAVKALVSELIEKTLVEFLTEHPDGILWPSNIPFSRIQAVNVSHDPKRPIIISLTNDPTELEHFFQPHIDQPRVILDLEMMRKHCEYAIRQLQNLSADFEEGLQRLTLVPKEEKEMMVAGIRRFCAEIIQMVEEAVVDLHHRIGLVKLGIDPYAEPPVEL